MNKQFRVIDFDDRFSHHDPKRDLPPQIEIKLKTNTIRITKGGPFGFWEISYERGRTPPQLLGQWTSVADAKKEIAKYLKGDGRLYQAEGQL